MSSRSRNVAHHAGRTLDFIEVEEQIEARPIERGRDQTGIEFAAVGTTRSALEDRAVFRRLGQLPLDDRFDVVGDLEIRRPASAGPDKSAFRRDKRPRASELRDDLQRPMQAAVRLTCRADAGQNLVGHILIQADALHEDLQLLFARRIAYFDRRFITNSQDLQRFEIAADQHDRHRRFFARAKLFHEVLHQVQGGLIEPLRVVQQKNDRVLPGQPPQHPGDGRIDLILIDGRGAIAGRVVEEDRGKGNKRSNDAAQGLTDLLQLRLALGKEIDGEMPGEGLTEWRVGDRFAAGRRARTAQYACRARRRRFARGILAYEPRDRGIDGRRLSAALLPDDNHVACFAAQQRREAIDHGLDPLGLLKVGVFGAAGQLLVDAGVAGLRQRWFDSRIGAGMFMLAIPQNDDSRHGSQCGGTSAQPKNVCAQHDKSDQYGNDRQQGRRVRDVFRKPIGAVEAAASKVRHNNQRRGHENAGNCRVLKWSVEQQRTRHVSRYAGPDRGKQSTAANIHAQQRPMVCQPLRSQPICDQRQEDQAGSEKAGIPSSRQCARAGRHVQCAHRRRNCIGNRAADGKSRQRRQQAGPPRPLRNHRGMGRGDESLQHAGEDEQQDVRQQDQAGPIMPVDAKAGDGEVGENGWDIGGFLFRRSPTRGATVACAVPPPASR